MASTLTELLIHIVFSTKNREPLIQPGFRDELEKYIGGIIRNEKSALLEIGGMPDHIHLVVRLSPDRSISDLVRLIKSNSSKWLNEKPGRNGRFGWQSGFGAFTVSQSQLDIVRDYVRRQEEHHRIRSFQEEYREFLKRHHIAYDEQYVWG